MNFIYKSLRLTALAIFHFAVTSRAFAQSNTITNQPSIQTAPAPARSGQMRLNSGRRSQSGTVLRVPFCLE
jgi:hypothetical protein